MTCSDLGSSFGASYTSYMGRGTVKLRHFKNLVRASSPDLFTLFSSVQKLETFSMGGRLFNLQRKET